MHLAVYPHRFSNTRTKTIGSYTIVEGRLNKKDLQHAYALGPVVGGKTGPVKIFWTYGEGCRWAEDKLHAV